VTAMQERSLHGRVSAGFYASWSSKQSSAEVSLGPTVCSSNVNAFPTTRQSRIIQLDNFL